MLHKYNITAKAVHIESKIKVISNTSPLGEIFMNYNCKSHYQNMSI